jgi:hypothetical protein
LTHLIKWVEVELILIYNPTYKHEIPPKLQHQGVADYFYRVHFASSPPLSK